MTSKKEIHILLLSLLVTAGLIGAGTWLFRETLKPSQSSESASFAEGNSADRFADVKSVPSGIFNYGGSTTWATIRGIVDLEIQKARPEFRLNYVQQEGVAPSTQSGLELLAQGETAFSLASRLPSNKVLQALENRGVRVRLVPVADSFDAITVNPSLPLTQLTIDQLNAIRMGRISNWRDVGGPDLPIQNFYRDVNPDVLEEKPVLKGNPEPFTTPLEVIRKIAETPGSFSKLAAPLVVPQCTVKVLAVVNQAGRTVTPYKEPLIPPPQCQTQKNQINLATFRSGDYPNDLKNTLYVVIQQNGQIEQQVGEAYANFLLSNEGQFLLEQAGYLRIR